jgi:acetylornithine/N-succinyldiaminopimelate aminotransferase
MQGHLDTWKAREEGCMMRTYARKPVLFVRGQGVRLWDAEGREYLDFVSGLGACVTGHCHPAVVEAVAEQAGRLIQVSNLYYTQPQVELAEMLVSRAFPGRVFLCNSGTEACEGAIKLARKHMRETGREQRYEIITALRSFHGRTMGSLTATGQPDKAQPYAPLVPGFSHVPFNDLEALEEAVGERTCAVMLEPIQGEGGVYPAEQGYLAGAREICDRRGALLILDEVQTGMGRTGSLFAHQLYGVEPDIMTLAKGLASGLPIGAILAREEVASSFKPGDHGSTFGGGPVPCAAALATLRVLEEEGLVDNAARTGDYFAAGLRELAARGKAVVEVRGRGLMLALQLAEERAEEAAQAALERGLVINNIGRGVLRFLPPLPIGTAEVDRLLETLEDIL